MATRCTPRTPRWMSPAPAVLVLIVLGILTQGGCTRRYFRNSADREVDAILTQKDQYPVWKIEQYHVYPDPRSRFASQGNPDKPPMPPDDPAAAMLSPNPQRPYIHVGKGYMESTGYLELLALWDLENREEEARRQRAREEAGLPPPTESTVGSLYGPVGAATPYPNPLNSNKEPTPYLINADQSVEMGLINSREFQDRREDLYLTALPVTTERFAFSPQFFALDLLVREYSGKQTSQGFHNRWTNDSTMGVSKLFSTGGLLLARFANRTVVEMGGNITPRTTSVSTLNFDGIQPLLQGGGRAVTLEPLTQAERNLLYEIRDYARFRKEYYVAVMAGSNFGTTSVGATRFRRRATGFFVRNGVTGALVPLGVGGNLLQQASATNLSEGYLPTVLKQGLLNNERKNVAALERILRLFQAFREGGDISQLQVDRVEQQLLQSRSSVFQRDLDLRNSMDNFKIQLGLPVTTPLKLDVVALDNQNDQLTRFEVILNQFDQAREKAEKLYDPDNPQKLRVQLRQLVETAPLTRGVPFRADFLQRWTVWEKLPLDVLRARERQLREERRQRLAQRDELEESGKPIPKELETRIQELDSEIDLARFEQNLRRWDERPRIRFASTVLAGAQGLLPVITYLAPRRPEAIGSMASIFRELINDFMLLLLEARNQRFDATHQSWPEVPRVCLHGIDLMKDDLETAMEVGIQVALQQRFDLMNARALLMDAWRQIRVSANSLLGVFNVEYHLNSQTPPGLAEPFAFSGARTRHQLAFNGELPLVRIQERNLYRASLIAWERQRRNLMVTEDGIVAGVRTQIRQLRVVAENYRIQQRAVELAYLQVENALDTFRAPPVPTAPGQAATSSAGNAAALTQQLLDAQNSLLRTQSQLMTLWIQFLTARMQLYRDLELMPLDNRGVWTDDVATCECPATPPDAGPQAAPGNSSQSGESTLGPPTPAEGPPHR